MNAIGKTEVYENMLYQMINRMTELEGKVNCHLKRKGFSWE